MRHFGQGGNKERSNSADHNAMPSSDVRNHPNFDTLQVVDVRLNANDQTGNTIEVRERHSIRPALTQEQKKKLRHLASMRFPGLDVSDALCQVGVILKQEGQIQDALSAFELAVECTGEKLTNYSECDVAVTTGDIM